MYAIIRTGGKQYRVEPGEYLRIEKLDGDLGVEFDLKDILVVGGDKTFFGEPTLEGAKVTAVVTRQEKAPKVTVFKKKRRQGYRRMQGHRQFYTEIFIKSITSPEGQTTSAETAARVIDPSKKKALLEKKAEEKKAAKSEGQKPVKKAAKKASKKKVTKKKKKAGKKAGKKASGKKKTAKKKAAKKKTAAKKTTKKKTTKKG